MSWYRKVVADWNNIPAFLDHFEIELAEAKKEVKVTGNIEKASTQLPGYVEHRFGPVARIRSYIRTSKYTTKKETK